ncbi:MAG: hypothetical protein K6C10_03720 [Prevotella sp.]|nr:hypothetical protein [Prevotella sp.]
MAKTIEAQIEKSRNLVAGLRKHLSSGIGGGVTTAEIEEMERNMVALAAANEECDKLRAELSVKVKNMNQLLTTAKTVYLEHKRTIKNCYPQEQWATFGVPDKR